MFSKLTRHCKTEKIPLEICFHSYTLVYLFFLSVKIFLLVIQVLNDENPRLKLQEQFGRVYSEDDCMIFNVAVQQPETIVRISLFSEFKYAALSRLTIGINENL